MSKSTQSTYIKPTGKFDLKSISTLSLKPTLKLFLVLVINSHLGLSATAQDEVSTSDNERRVPTRSIKPRPRPALSPKKSPRPEPRDVVKYEGSELELLKSRPCPGNPYCPAPYRGFTQDGFSKDCNAFIGDEGIVSGANDSIGLMMYEAMREVEAANKKVTNQDGKLTGPPSKCTFNTGINFDRACPNFKDLNTLQKDHIWLWHWAAVAQTESTCNPETEAHGVENAALGKKEIADGLFGLEYSALVRSTNGRDPRFCPHDEIKDTKNLFYQTRCAASIMFDTQCGKQIYQVGGYWQQSQTFSGKVTALMKQHPLCAPKGSVQ